MLEKFTVIDLVQTRSDSIATVSGNYIKFNHQTAAELGYPAFVQFLFLEKSKQFAIRGCKEDAPNALPFCKVQGQKGQIRVTQATVAAFIRRMGGWGADEAWNIPGIYFAEDNGLVYDVRTAFEPVHRTPRTKLGTEEGTET